MLKSIAASLGLALALGSAHAQEQKKEQSSVQLPIAATCDITENIVKYVASFDEKPFSKKDAVVSASDGNALKGVLVIYVNPETKSNTVVMHFPEDGVSCVLAIGENFAPAF